MNRLSIFDTHCHLVDEKYEASDISAIIQAAKNEGINYILNVGYDKKSNESAKYEIYPIIIAFSPPLIL